MTDKSPALYNPVLRHMHREADGRMHLIVATAVSQAVDGVYTLDPAHLERARSLSRDFTILHAFGILWSVLKIVLMLSVGVVARFSDIAKRFANKPWPQGAIFTFLFLLASTLLSLPLRLYSHHLLVAYGLSIQPLGSWLGDQGKSFLITWLVALPTVMLLYFFLKRSPRRWWLWSALALMPMVAVGIFATPVIIAPLFDHFDPLQAAHPALVSRLEQVVARSGTVIPPERMFLMHASEKVTGLNAYVTGFGATKRVVVWDTTIAQASPDEISIIFAHELGHYVLNHVFRGFVESCLGILAGMFLARHLARRLHGRFGPSWQIPEDAARRPDWGYFGILMLTYVLISIPAEPIANTLSRQIEHEADVYGQEAMHTLVADPRALAAQSWQHLGENYLDLPDPNSFVEFWTYDHPSISHRKSFAAIYDPWAPNQSPRYFSR